VETSWMSVQIPKGSWDHTCSSMLTPKAWMAGPVCRSVHHPVVSAPAHGQRWHDWHENELTRQMDQPACTVFGTRTISFLISSGVPRGHPARLETCKRKDHLYPASLARWQVRPETLSPGCPPIHAWRLLLDKS
jgi:hypothetical protein